MLCQCPPSQTSKPCPSGHVFDARYVHHLPTPRTFVDHPEHRNRAHLGTFLMLCVCPPLPICQTLKKCPDGHGFDAWHLSTTSPTETSKNCPSGHVFDALRVSTTSPPPEHRNRAHLDMISMLGAHPPLLHPLNIEKMPRWAWFRCSAFIHYPVHHIPTCRTSKKCPDRHGFDVRRLSTIPNIKTMPTWACFRCSACVHHLLTRVHYILTSRTSKPCSDAHVFDVRRVSTTTPPAEPQNYCHLGTFLMFGVCPRAPNFGTMPGWA